MLFSFASVLASIGVFSCILLYFLAVSEITNNSKWKVRRGRGSWKARRTLGKGHIHFEFLAVKGLVEISYTHVLTENL